MSGYLARLAARAGGAPAAAGPRLPSRFEPSAGSAPTNAAALVPPPPGTLAHDDLRSPPQPGATRADERTAAIALKPAGAVAALKPADAVAALPPPDDRGREAHGAVGEVAVPTLPTNAAFRAPPATERRGPPPPATAVAAAAPRVEAAPPPRVEAPRPQHAAATVTPVQDRVAASSAPEPDVVHVTIGRVEVRATVAAQTAAARVPRPPRDAERALHDYLAGRAR